MIHQELLVKLFNNLENMDGLQVHWMFSKALAKMALNKKFTKSSSENRIHYSIEQSLVTN